MTKKLLFALGVVSSGATPSSSSTKPTPSSSSTKEVSIGNAKENPTLIGPTPRLESKSEFKSASFHQTIHAPSNPDHAYHRRITDISQVGTVSEKKRRKLEAYLAEHGHVYETTLIVPTYTTYRLDGLSSTPEAERKEIIGEGSKNQNSSQNSHRALQGGSVSHIAAQVWAIRNAIKVEKGWRVAELQFFEDEGCSRTQEAKVLRYGPTFAVGETPAPGNKCHDINYGPSKAFDGFMNTIWVAQCCPCEPYEAHIGADFGAPVVVQCAKIWQSLFPYYSSEVTLSKEGTTTGLMNNLWVDVVTWTGLSDAPSIQTSGITTGMTSITFKKHENKQCHGNTYGQEFKDLSYAKNSCVSDPTCGAVYEQSCSFLQYTARLTNNDDYKKIKNILKTITEPSKTLGEPDIVYQKTTEPLQLNDDNIIPNSRLIQPPMLPDTITKQQYYGTGFTLTFEVKPIYGAIRTCRKATTNTAILTNTGTTSGTTTGDTTNTGTTRSGTTNTGSSSPGGTNIDESFKDSTEGSCVWEKQGALLSYTSHSNKEVSSSRFIQLVWTQTAAECAQKCLSWVPAPIVTGQFVDKDAPTQCDGFLHVIRENGNPPTDISCKLLSLPDDPNSANYFDKQKDVIGTDGTLEVVDFYIRQNWGQNQTQSETKVTGTAPTSETIQNIQPPTINTIITILIGMWVIIYLSW